MKCKCGEHKLVRRGRKGYRQHVDQLGAGISVSHQRNACLRFERGNAPLAKNHKGELDEQYGWSNVPRPQTMEVLA